MDKTNYKTIKLAKGEIYLYDFGKIKLHAYRTDDLISDEVFIVEKEKKAVIIESPCFFDNERALSEYLEDLDVEGMLVAYHAAGGKFMQSVKKYGTSSAKEYGEQGGGKALIDNFTKAFGFTFDRAVHNITEILPAGKTTIAGIDFVITPNSDAYDIELPEINVVYTHMVGNDCHSIVANAAHADAIISQLESYIEKGVNLILSSHYTPEDVNDAETKIEYLKNVKAIAERVNTAEDFKAEMLKKYPNYGGVNYLDMTAAMFFD